MTKYEELLKDPRWDVKRYQILQRDNFCCKVCGDRNSVLHVHHKRYINGKMPWEYKDSDLMTLCEDHHKQAHAEMEITKQGFIDPEKFLARYPVAKECFNYIENHKGDWEVRLRPGVGPEKWFIAVLALSRYIFECDCSITIDGELRIDHDFYLNLVQMVNSGPTYNDDREDE